MLSWDKKPRVLIPPQDLSKCGTCGGSRGFWVFARGGDPTYVYERRRPDVDINRWSMPDWEHCRTCDPKRKRTPKRVRCKGKTSKGSRCKRRVMGHYCGLHRDQSSYGVVTSRVTDKKPERRAIPATAMTIQDLLGKHK